MNSRFEMQPVVVWAHWPLRTAVTGVLRAHAGRREFQRSYRQLGFTLLFLFDFEHRDGTRRSIKGSVIRDFTI